MKRVLAFAGLAVAFACGESAPPPPVQPTATTSAPAPSASSAPSAPASVAVAPPAPAKDVACDALDGARKAEYAHLESIADSQDPMSRVQNMSEDVVAAFAKCIKTKAGGAWGLGLRDVKVDQAAHGVSAQLLAVHADKDGHVVDVLLQGSARTKDRAFQSLDTDHVAMETQMAFDFDGDGEDEFVAIGHDQTKEGPRDPMAYIVQVKNGAAQMYAPAKDLPIFRVEDVDRDGRPDFVSYGPYRAIGPARCNGAPAQFVGPALLIHSLEGGTFSMTDDKALAFAKQHCDKPGFEVARDDEKRVDDDQTFVNVACARMWGMPEAQLSSLVSQGCHAIRGEAGCKESSLTSCVYPAEMTKWAHEKPPLTLK